MKARWLIITLLLAFPFAFAFFLSEARLGEKRKARTALIVAPSSAQTAASDMSPIGPTRPIGLIPENPAPAANTTAATAPDPANPPPSIENRESKIQNPPAPTLLTGTFAREDNSLIYDADAKLLLSKDVILSSPTGVMVSNEKQTLFAGDMQIESGKNIITAHEGVLDTTTSQMKATVASISFTNENNQMVRMTGESVTLDLPSENKAAAGKITLSDAAISLPTPPAPATSSPVPLP